MVFDPLFLSVSTFFILSEYMKFPAAYFGLLSLNVLRFGKKVRLTVLKFNDNDAQHVYTIAAKMLCNCFGMQCKNAFV